MRATIYNRYQNAETRKEEWRRTVLSGRRAVGGGHAVHWENNRATNVITSGLAAADAVSVMIWFSVTAEGRTYLPPMEYAALSPAEVGRYWTMTPGHDRLLKGVGPAVDGDITIGKIAARDGCITITSVDAMDFGRPHMHHWEVSGK